MEELLVALILLDPVALVGEALELVVGLFHGGGEVGTLALHHGQGDAVHEEHDVRDHELLCLAAGFVHPKLVDGPKLVVLRMVPVDVAGGVALTVVPAGEAFHHRAFEQELHELLVGLQELQRSYALEGRDRLAHPRLVEPLLALVVEVDADQSIAEIVEEERLAEVISSAGGGMVEVSGAVLPAHGDELVDEGLLNELELRAFHQARASSASGTRTLPVRRSSMRPCFSSRTVRRARFSCCITDSCSSIIAASRFCSGRFGTATSMERSSDCVILVLVPPEM